MNAHRISLGDGVASCFCGATWTGVNAGAMATAHLASLDSVWLTEHDVARELGLSVKTMSNWRNRDQGPPYVKLNRAVRYRRTDLDAWIESRTVRP
jgi:predicted DNA-binding transcriptional regulator AlpA